MALLRPVLRHRFLLMRQVLPPELVAIATGHSAEHRFPVEKTDDNLGPVLAATSPAGLALHAMRGREIRGLGLPGVGMDFVHARSSRWMI